MTDQHTRLLIVDDHPALRAGLQGMLASQPDFEVVGEAANGVEGVKLADQLQPDVVLMDLRMPEMDGVTAIAQIKAQHPDVQVLVLTTYDSDADILPAIRSGAIGYLLKDTPREDLFQAIRSAAQGRPLLAPGIAARLMERMRAPNEEAPSARETEAPTPGDRDASNKEPDSPKQAANIPTGTVTFLFTDIEGSTAMWEKYPEQMQTALARHDEILHAAIEARGGYVFKMIGDACCAAFASDKQATLATLEAQRALFAETWDEHTTIRVRMALHTGVAEEKSGDYFGPPVNRVARLLSAGHGGQVLLSAVTYGLARDTLRHLEPGSELRDLGEHRLRDLRYSERIYQLVVSDLPADFPPLRTLDTRSDERYSLTRIIGSGEMAEVYLAHDQELDRNVAFKVLRHQYADDEQFVERFRREARHAASLSHPNIVAVHDRGETADGAYYIVMEYMAGGTLKDRIEKEGPLPPPVATTLALQIAKALEAAHQRGVIHRDIKPQNVLLTEKGEAKVGDFGIARAASSATMTKTGDVMGTARYISPEQAMGQPASPQGDLYSLGVVLYEMLTGELPHDADTPVGIVMGRVSGQLRPPREVNPDVPEGINAVAVRLLAPNPEDRYQSAAELIADLERVQRGDPPERLAQQQAASPAIPPSRPSISPDFESRPRLPEPWELDAPSASPPPARPGGARNGGRHRKVLLRRLAVMLIAAVVLVGAGVIAWFLVPYASPSYVLLEHDSGALSVEIPSEWDDHVLVDSEGERGRNWSSLLGESVGPSVTAVDDLDAWRNGTVGHQGVYMVASRKLAQGYADDELVALGPNDYSSSCEAGTPRNFDQAPYSGKILKWNNCGGDSDHTALTLAAAPKGRECVVVAQIGGYLRNEEESIQQILDTFEVDCGRIT